MPKALVTGASGFIGSMLARELAGRGYEVGALLRKTSNVSHLNSVRYERLEGDLSDSEALKKAMKGVDVVFHLAGVTSASRREDYFKHNSQGVLNIAQAAAEAAPGLKRFVLVSSLAAAGPSQSLDFPKVETSPESPVSAYGESKLQGEKEVLRFKDRFPVTIIRPPMVYGPRDKGVFMVIRTVSRRMMPLLRGGTKDGNKYYSVIHVRDLCRGIIQAGECSDVASGEVFYLTDGGQYAYRELLSMMASSLGVRPFEFTIPPFAMTAAAGVATAVGALTRRSFALNWDKLNEILPDFWICSTDKAKQVLGYVPQYDLSTGMADAIQWYRDEQWI